MVDAAAGSFAQRVVALVLLLLAGAMSLPVAAFFLDGEGTENYIVPAQLAAMAAIGAVVGMLLPGLARGGSSRARSARVGAAVGVGMAVLGVAVFFLLINGINGA